MSDEPTGSRKYWPIRNDSEDCPNRSAFVDAILARRQRDLEERDRAARQPAAAARRQLAMARGNQPLSSAGAGDTEERRA